MSVEGPNEPQSDAEACEAPEIEHLITPRRRDLGGFTVGRVLPYAKKRMVGPFIFFDEMGPADFAPGRGVDVRPHPHIGLSTVTYLFEGEMTHRDNLGCEQVIRPGDVNWMTAGRGVVHSERTGDEARASGHRLHGVQTWVSLPENDAETDPAFHHHTADALPTVGGEGWTGRLILGSAFGETSPVAVFSPIFYVAVDAEPGAWIDLTDDHEDRAVYVVSGAVAAAGERVGTGTMAVFKPGAAARLEAASRARLMLLGGAPLGERKIWWNFVASDAARLERAKAEWAAAAEAGFPEGGVFTLPPGEEEHIPLPPD